MDFTRTTWADPDGSKYEVARREPDGTWRVTIVNGYRWRAVYMTDRELFKKFYDFGRLDVVPEELQLEFSMETK